MRLLAEELLFAVGAKQEGEALEIASQLAYAAGGVTDEPGERFTQLARAGGEPVIDELQQFDEFGDVNDEELDDGFGCGHRRVPSRLAAAARICPWAAARSWRSCWFRRAAG